MLATYLQACWDILVELAPWLFVGALLAGLLHALVPSSFVVRHLGGRGLGTMIRASALGVPLPLCSCSVIPTGLGLRRQGASAGASVSFLTSTPQTGVDSIMVTAAFLGWPFALYKVAAAMVTGVVAGLLSERMPHPALSGRTAPATGGCCGAAAQAGGCRDGDPATPGDGDDCCGLVPAPPRGWRARARAALVFGHDLVRMIWRWLALGILLSAALTVALPEGWWPTGGWAGLGAMLLCLAISIPLYVCALASVPIAAALVAGGMPAGAALVFLMAGPATNVATIGAVGRVLGWRVAGVYVGTVAVGSIALGLLYEAWIPLEVAAVEAAAVHGAHHPAAQASAALLLALLASFALRDVARWWRARRAKEPKPAEGGCGSGCGCATRAAPAEG